MRGIALKTYLMMWFCLEKRIFSQVQLNEKQIFLTKGYLKTPSSARKFLRADIEVHV